MTPQTLPRPSELDGWSFGGSTVAHVLFLLLVFFTPPALDGLTLHSLRPSDRFLELVVRAPRERREEVPGWFERHARQRRPADRVAEGERDRQPGAAGHKDAPKRSRRASRRGAPGEGAVDGGARRRVRQLPIFEALRGAGEITTAGVDSVSAVAAGPVNADGHPFGLVIGNVHGVGGPAPAGALQASASLLPAGPGRLSLEDVPRRPCRGKGCEHRTRVPPKREVVPPDEGRLERAMIRRVIARNRHGVRHCYERALQHRPGLEGRVAVTFVVGPDGRVLVARVKDSGIGDRDVERCLLARVRRLTFPARKGRSVVEVTYPFLFRPI